MMRSPEDMWIIQIEITNACIHNCSNCTRFCGLHKAPFFMEPDFFKKAVDSMKGFKGVVGIMGGEPTLHPKFSEMLTYYAENIPEPRPRTSLDFPTPSFREQVQRSIYLRGRHRGLWSSMGNGYYRHFEQIQDIFPYQVLNDHKQVNQHQALMITRKELGIPDAEWVKLRDRCWVQNLWSASITPKGAFFCEMAGSLDLLLDGPGGWPVEPGWWKRKPKDFADQMQWCELCSAALNVPSMPASAQTDIVSPVMLKKLENINGWKIKNKKYVVFDPTNYNPQEDQHAWHRTWFLPDGSEDQRVSATDSTLFPKHLDVAVLKGESALATISPAQLEAIDFPDFVIVAPDGKSIDEDVISRARKCIFNPGFIYYTTSGVCIFNARAQALKDVSTLIINEKLRNLWPRQKRARLRNYPRIGEPTSFERAKQLIAILIHRGTFLLPIWRRLHG